MHTKNYILISILFISAIHVFANPIDSIGVENENTKKIILHKVDPRESYYSIARRYSVPVKAVIDFNNNKMLQPGMTIRIPTDQPFKDTSTRVVTGNYQGEIIEYKVGPKEYLGIIAKKFNTTVEDIKELNDLNSNNLSIGQILKVRTNSPSVSGSAQSAEKQATAISKQYHEVTKPNSFEIIEYKVGPREYLNSIAKKFNTTAEDIKELNNLKSNILAIGQIIKIKPGSSTDAVPGPVEKPDAATARNTQGDVVDYKVGKKETMSSIATKFNTTVDDIKALNNLKSTSLAIGQIIKVRYATAQTGLTPVILSPKIPNSDYTLANDTTIINASDRLKRPATVYGLHEVVEKGVGIWISDDNIDVTKMLALHRTAPIGTIIKVTNPMTGRSTFAKVVGKFTENESTKDVIVVITKAAADVIGVLDKRFQTSIVYGVTDDE